MIVNDLLPACVLCLPRSLVDWSKRNMGERGGREGERGKE